MIQNVAYMEVKMYCRNCGEPISEKEVKCLACNTTNGEGIDYCNICGGYTTERTKYCRGCGAKLRTIVPKKIRAERYKEIVKQVNVCKKKQSFFKAAVTLSIIIIAVLVVIIAVREEPDNIPEPPNRSTLSPNTFYHDEFLRVGDTYYYSSDISEEVAEYWIQNRKILGYVIISVLVLISTFIGLFLEKSKYKKLLVVLKEAKNVL